MERLIFVGLVLWGAYYFLRPKRSRAGMAETEARAVLGVGGDADAEQIRAAHRRLIAAVHPDRGGSAELARRINSARDTLLR